MLNLASIAAVAAGGFCGGVMRLQLARLSTPLRPTGTLMANSLACFLLGMATGLELGSLAALFFATGLCGALSTMSTFIKEVVTLGWLRGACYLALTLFAGALVFYAGVFSAHVF